nr:MAG TPA: hypothetical protein [Caudoviricetes sp.]
MNKQQQIEETERWLCRICSHYETCNNSCKKRKDFAEALYNAGYRKVSSSEAELQDLNIKYYNEAKDLRRQLADTEVENKRLSAKLGQILLSIDTVKEMNAMCNIDEQRKQAVKEFAKKLKKKVHNYYPSIDSYCTSRHVILVKDIDELLKEYE